MTRLSMLAENANKRAGIKYIKPPDETKEYGCLLQYIQHRIDGSGIFGLFMFISERKS